MKKIFLTAFMAVCAMTANAQVWMGGAVGFDVTDYDGADKNEFTFRLAPEVGYSLNEKWDIAASLGISTIKNESGIKDANGTSFTINPYARYTFAKAGIASFFVDGGFGYGIYHPKHGDNTNNFYIGVRPGVKVALSEKVCLVSHLGYLGYQWIEDHSNSFGLGVDNNTIDFGLYWSF